MLQGRWRWVGVALGCLVGVGLNMEHAMGAASNTIRLANSARQAAMGGTCRALTADGISPLCNPAAIVFQEGSTFQMNGGLLLTKTRYEDPENDSQSGGKGSAGVNGLGDRSEEHTSELQSQR